jgi:hypothetical protein
MLHAYLHTICFIFCYTSWRFYAFSGTILLTRCHSASSQFSAIFVFQKSYTGNILGIGQTKAKPPIFTEASRRPKMRRRGARGQPHHQGARPSPWSRPPVVRPPGPTSDAYPSPISSSRWEKPRGRIFFPWNILQTTAVAVARSGWSKSSSWHTAGEGNPCQRPSTPPWSPPEWCVSSLTWTMSP